MIVFRLVGVALLVAAVPFAHYAGVGAHEATHCFLHASGDSCRVLLYRPPASDGGVDGVAYDLDSYGGWWWHLAPRLVEYGVYAAFLAPGLVAWSVRR